MTAQEGGSDRSIERAVLAVAFVLFVAVTLWTALHHEPWRDEGDTWLLMRDGDVAAILESASNGGTPLLFHLTLWPFARLGAPFVVQQILSLIYVWAAVLLLFRSAAFALPVRILFAFSYFPAFELPVVSRAYGLQMLLTFAMAASWRERQTRPIRVAVAIALLANVTTHALFTAAVAGALLTAERLLNGTLRQRAILYSTATMLAGGFLAVVQVWPREGRQHVYQLVTMDTLWFALASTFFPEQRVEDFLGPALVVLAIVTYCISRRLVPLLFLCGSWAALLTLYVFIWMGGLRHAALLLIVVMAAVWIADAYGPHRRERLLMAALAVSFALSIGPAVHAWINETRYSFSGSREVARYLNESGLARDAVLVAPPNVWTAPLVYLPSVKLRNAVTGEFRTFARWDQQNNIDARMPLAEQLARAEARFAGRRWVFLLNRDLPEALRPRYRLLFRTSDTIWRMNSETYWVYEPRGRPQRRSDVPAPQRHR